MKRAILILILFATGLAACKKNADSFIYHFSFETGGHTYSVDSVYLIKLDTVYFNLTNNSQHAKVYINLTASTNTKSDNLAGLYGGPNTTGTFGKVISGNFLVITDGTDKNNGNYLPGNNFYLRITQDDGHTLSGTFSGGLVFSGSNFGNTGQASNTISNGQFSITYK